MTTTLPAAFRPLPTWRGYIIDERLRQFRKEAELEFLAFDSEEGAQLYREVFLAELTPGDTVQLSLGGLTRGEVYRGRVFTVVETPPGSYKGTYALAGQADYLFDRSELLRCDAPTWAEELAPAKAVSILVIEVRCPIDGSSCLDQFGSPEIRMGANPVRCPLCERVWSVPQAAFVQLPHHFMRINAPVAWLDEHLLALHGARFEAGEGELLGAGGAERELVFPLSTHRDPATGGAPPLSSTYHYTLPGGLSCTLCGWVFGERSFNAVSWVQPVPTARQLVVALIAEGDREALAGLGAELAPWQPEKRLRPPRPQAQPIESYRGTDADHPLVVVLPAGTERLETLFLGPVGYQAHGENAPTYARQTDYRLPGGAPWCFSEAVSRPEEDGALTYSARFIPKEAGREDQEHDHNR